MSGAWLFQQDDVTLFDDSDEHVALVLRTLRIDERRWRKTLSAYASHWSPALTTVDARLAALRDAFAKAMPPGEANVPHRATEQCPACHAVALAPRYARTRRDAPGAAFVYTHCSECGHGTMLDGHVPLEAYASPTYYQTQNAAGVGYADYGKEREYRETKGRRLIEEVLPFLAVPATSLLEVGSGFGFTRAAAELMGLATFGVDLNPAAADAARELYAMDTFVGALSDALTAGAVRLGEWDITLYNFVLEHVSDPDRELRDAAATLRPGGALVLVIPSMDAREVDVFGGSYRSFRSDHLHMFSRRSITHYLARAGLRVDSITTTCSAHLFRGFLDDAELRELYERGEGPDMTVIARRR